MSDFVLEMETSPSLVNLTKALANAQKKYKPIKKECYNPYTNSYYADLFAIISATQDALNSEELVVIQAPVVDISSKQSGVVSILSHSSGEYIKNRILLPATMRRKKKQGEDEGQGNEVFNAQSIGGGFTYARRYAYEALTGTAGEVDDDGNRVSQDEPEKGTSVPEKVTAETPPKRAYKKKEDPVSDVTKEELTGFYDRCKKITETLANAGLTAAPGQRIGTRVANYILKLASAESLENMTKQQWQVLDIIEKLLAESDGAKKQVALIGGESGQ